MYHTSYGHAAMGYEVHEWTPRVFFGAAGLGVLAGASALTFYATPEEGFRFGPEMLRDADGEVPLYGDTRFLLAVASIATAGWALVQDIPMLAAASGILGTSAVASLVSTEGIRWREDGKLFGIEVPQLPVPAEAVVEAPALIEEEMVTV